MYGARWRIQSAAVQTAYSERKKKKSKREKIMCTDILRAREKTRGSRIKEEGATGQRGGKEVKEKKKKKKSNKHVRESNGRVFIRVLWTCTRDSKGLYRELRLRVCYMHLLLLAPTEKIQTRDANDACFLTIKKKTFFF